MDMNTSTEKAPVRNFNSNPAVRLWNHVTGQYLHQSGAGDTVGTAYSWIGFKHQAATLQRRAKERGEAWPYSTVGAEIIRHKGRVLTHDEIGD
jgi:hypothetical protein